MLTNFTFQEKGQYFTEARRKITDLLVPKGSRAYTCAEISNITKLNRSTVSRILALLQKQKFLHKSQNRYYMCRLEDDSACHQTVICEKCGKFEETALYEHAHPNLRDFKIPVQVHEISAICKQCQYTSAK